MSAAKQQVLQLSWGREDQEEGEMTALPDAFFMGTTARGDWNGMQRRKRMQSMAIKAIGKKEALDVN
jgi:hypothetical protein